MKYEPPYIPKDAKWYLAEIIMETVFDADYFNAVDNNWTLVRADSPEEAYEKALLLGKESELVYDNTDGKKVTVSFRGLGNLHVIYDAFEHGAEIIYERHQDVSYDTLAKMLRPKEQLNVFAPREVSDDELL